MLLLSASLNMPGSLSQKRWKTRLLFKKNSLFCVMINREKHRGALGEAPGAKCGACHTPNLWAEAETLF